MSRVAERPAITAVSPDVKRATQINDRMVTARRAETSMWIHQAQAILDMRAVKGWESLGLESLNEWLAQPGIAVGQSKARKMAATLTAYLDREFDDLDRLGGIDWSTASVTAGPVASGRVTPEKALDLAETMTKPQLEVELRDPDKAIDAESEPEKCRCVTCGNVHRPKDGGDE